MTQLGTIVTVEHLLFALHSLLIASVVILAAQLIATGYCRRHASARHSVWFATLVLVAVAPAIALLTRASGMRLVSVPVDFANHSHVPASPRALPAEATASTMGNSPTPTTQAEELSNHLDEATPSLPFASEPPSNVESRVKPAIRSTASTVSSETRMTVGLSVAEACLFIGLIVWFLGAIYLAARLLLGLFKTSWLLQRVSPFDAASLETEIGVIKDTLAVSQLPEFATSPNVTCPVVLGIVRPQVVLPPDLAKRVSSEQLVSMLTHECAHIVRHDQWVTLLQRIVAIAYWPFPQVHWMNRQLDLAREEVCDNFVLRRSNATDFAEALVRVAELCALPNRGALAIISRHQPTEVRIKSILEDGRDCRTRASAMMLAMIYVVLLLSLAAVMLVHPVSPTAAQERQVRADDDEQRTSLRYPIKLGKSLLRHGGSVSSVAFDPQGRFVASCGQPGIKLWDAKTGELVRTFDHGRRGAGSIDFSPNGKLLASGGLDWTVRIFHVETGFQLHMLPAHRYGLLGRVQPIQVAFTKDGKLVSAGHEGVVQVWNPNLGKKVREIPGPGEPNDRRSAGAHGIYSLAVSPDGETVATSSYQGAIRLIDIAGEKPPRELIVTKRRAKLTFSPSGALAWCGDEIVLWDLDANQEQRRLTGHQDFNRRIAFNSDGSRLISAGGPNEIKLWDPSTGKELWTARGHTDSVISLAFSKDATTIASGGSDGSVRLWDAEKGKERFPDEGPELDRVVALAAPRDGTTLVAYKHRLIQTWDQEGRPQRSFEVAGDDLHYRGSVAFSKDGRVVAVGHNSQVDLWDVKTGTQQWSHNELGQFENVDIKKPVADGFRFSRDAKFLIGKTSDSRDPSRGQTILRVWEVESGQLLNQFAVPRRVPHLPAFSGDGEQFALNTYATGDPRVKRMIDDVRIEVYETREGKLLREFKSREKFGNAFGWSPDGRMFATGTSRSRIGFWNVEDGELLFTLQGPLYGTNFLELRFSPDGKRIAAASGAELNVIFVWDLETGRLTHQFPVATRHLAFSEDSTKLLAGQTDGVTLVWPLDETHTKPSAPPTREQIAERWYQLAWGRDTSRGNLGNYERTNALVAGGDETIDFLEKELLVLNPTERDQNEVQQLVAPLGNEDSRVRADAARRLEKFGDNVRALVRKAENEQGPVSAESIRSIEEALIGWMQYRRNNAVYYVISQIGTPKAERLLKRLSERLEDENARRRAGFDLTDLQELKIRRAQ